MFLSNSCWLLATVFLLAFILDRLLGEPRRYHPLVAFGRLAGALETQMNRGAGRRWRGALAWAFLVLPPVVAVALVDQCLKNLHSLWALPFHILVLYWAIAWRSMGEHLLPIVAALEKGDLPLARQRLSWIVSRDTEAASADEIVTASLESALENSSDALFASLLWYALLGPAGVVLHRLANTLDAMWGYRNARFCAFGWCSARSDDALNFLPAQLTALSFTLLSCSPAAARCWWQQGCRWKSINAGAVMASGAAALGVTLGGSARYHGQGQARPVLGCGRRAEAADIKRALRLVEGVFALWLLLLLMAGVFV